MKIGKSSWSFENKPVILGTGTVGGPFEGQGRLRDEIDLLHGDIYCGEDSFEKAERKMQEEACNIAIKKAGINKENVDFLIGGDLINQIISSSFTARTMEIPFLGIYGACSCSMQGLAIASMLVSSGYAQNAMAATSSHNGASEKQYRYPTEYGAQKPPTAQWTVTGAGAALVGSTGQGPKVLNGTIGKIIDLGIKDPFNMGAAMAPAAVDTIDRHFQDMGIDHNAYDLIITGDLGKVGHEISLELLNKAHIDIPREKFVDCGMLIYHDNQEVFSGGSGCACAALTTYGHFINRLKRKDLKNILVIATGAMLSPLSYQQKESIPCIAHAVSIEA